MSSKATFGDCLSQLLFVEGVRAKTSKKKSGECWTIAEFAFELDVHERTVRNWLSNKKIPHYLNAIEKALFGPENKADPGIVALREAHRRAKEWEPSKTEPEAVNHSTEAKPILPSKVGAQILHPEIRPVPGFTGRQDLFDSLDRSLWQHGGTAALTNATSAAVHGLGGVGKSVLAQEYAWRNRARYRGVWWLRAEKPESLLDDLIALGSRLGVPSIEDIPERDRAAHLALDAIRDTATDKPWLLIYDNAESPAALDKLTPAGGAHLIVTSRWSDWFGHAEALPVDVFPPEVAADYHMEHARHPDREAAARLAEALGYLPLALSHARATCWASNLDFDSYRARLPELIRKAPRRGAYPHAVYATFDLAIGKAAAICPHAERLMEIVAFLAPNRIPADLITDEIMSESERDDALAALAELSLITHETLDDGSRAFSVHRLVQEVMRSRLGDGQQASQQIALRLMRKALDAVSVQEHGNWPHVARRLPHALAVLNGAPDEGEGAEITAKICALLDLYLYARGDYASALPQSRRALAIAETALGPDHPDTGTILNNLAELHRAQGKYEEAEPLVKRALAICEVALGSDHPDTGTSLNNLAELYRVQGKYEAAEPLYRRALAIREQALGPDHPYVGQSLNNLAELYDAQGKYEAAEPLVISALAIAEQALGPDHPDVGQSLNNLAALYRAQGKYQAAEPLYRRALAIRERALGPDHPYVGTDLNNLALLYAAQGKYEAAEPLFLRALAIREKALGPEHPDVGQSLNSLAGLYRAHGKYEAAEPLYIRALGIAEKALGPEHPNTKQVKANYEIFKAERTQ